MGFFQLKSESGDAPEGDTHFEKHCYNYLLSIALELARVALGGAFPMSNMSKRVII